MRVEFLTPASGEFLAGADFYEPEAPGLGAEFIQYVEASTKLITEFPSLDSPGPQDTRRIHLYRFPYSLVYRREPDLLRVIAVEHHKRKPGFWKGRI